jgi:hypothetical protein
MFLLRHKAHFWSVLFSGKPGAVQKAHLRRIGARTFDQLIHAIGEIFDLFTPDECWNVVAAAGNNS